MLADVGFFSLLLLHYYRYTWVVCSAAREYYCLLVELKKDILNGLLPFELPPALSPGLDECN